jgi:copper chaperone CopZ
MSETVSSKVEIDITGMTCGHCASSITKEISALAGVSSVAVDHTSGKAVVGSENSLSESALTSAVEAAGYHAVGFKQLV